MTKYFIFDIDGTLYDFDKGEKNNSGRTRTYDESNFKKDLTDRVRSYFQNIWKYSDETWSKLKREMEANKDPVYSRIAEDRHGVDRTDYFNYVWDLDPSKYVLPNKNLKNIFKTTKNNLIISNAGKIWVTRVLKILDIEEYFDSHNLLTGELKHYKPNPKIFLKAAEYFKTEPSNCYSIGDQEEKDIIPAQKLGMKTIMVRNKCKRCVPNHEIDSINELLEKIQAEN